MSDPLVYGLSESVYTRIVRLVLEEKEIDYDLIDTDIFSESGIPQEHLNRHPFGRIPALEHESFVIYETCAINVYIDEAFSGVSLSPSDIRKKARMNQIISILDSYAYFPMIWNIFVPRVIAGDSSSNIEEAVQTTAICLRALEDLLSNQDFFIGNDVTLADLHAVPMLFYLSQTPEGRQMLSKHVRLSKWMEKMIQRQSFINTKSIYG